MINILNYAVQGPFKQGSNISDNKEEDRKQSQNPEIIITYMWVSSLLLYYCIIITYMHEGSILGSLC